MSNDKHIRRVRQEGWNTDKDYSAARNALREETIEEMQESSSPDPPQPTDKDREIVRLQNEIKALRREVRTWKAKAKHAFSSYVRHWSGYFFRKHKEAAPTAKQALERMEADFNKMMETEE